MKNNNTKVKVEKIKVDGGFELNSGIPMPEVTNERGVKSPFRKTVEVMKIGQCFDVDVLPKHHYAIQKKVGVKLLTKKMPNGKVRVWRRS